LAVLLDLGFVEAMDFFGVLLLAGLGVVFGLVLVGALKAYGSASIGAGGAV